MFHDEVLRFVRDFVDYFDIGANKTRVALIQVDDGTRLFAERTSKLDGRLNTTSARSLQNNFLSIRNENADYV